MADTVRTDDAPPAAFKTDGGPEQVTATIKDAKGSAVVARAVTIDRPAAELFAYFRDFANLATFMENIERIDILDEKRSHWVVKAPAGGRVEWDARVTDEAKDRFIAWTSEEGAEVPNSGRVDFREAGDRGTIVTMTMLYDPPAGIVGKIIAKMFQREPNMQARQDLKRFKQLMETGEVATRARNQAEYAEEKN